jgi:radical SAM superfamily enzyme YgiQ (UPF0313 family)
MKSKKVVLIQPRNTLALNIYPPLNLIKIGSVLQAAGFEVKIITCPTVRNYREVMLKCCSDALLVGIGVLTTEVPDAIMLARAIKERYSVPIVWGGWHATLFPEQTAASTLVDHVVVDEGDAWMLKIANHYYGEDIENTMGDILRNEEHLDLDQLPSPDYSLVPNIEYYMTTLLADKFLEYDDRLVRWLPYEASRGCPSHCAFCINVVTNNQRYRKKSAAKVVDEIEQIVRRHAINHLKIVDDNFFVDVRWVKEIAQGLIDKKLGITWDAECRVDYLNDAHVNDECLGLCVRSGLNELNFGIESGSQHSLDIMRKGITPEQSLHALRTAARYAIVSRCSFIMDVPGETEEDIYETVRLINEIRKIPRTTCGVHSYRPYPRSELCEGLLRNGAIIQPSSFEGWAEQKYVEQFAYTEVKRKWQKNHKLSSKISFYQCLESGFWLRPHQVRNNVASVINRCFMYIAKLRNRYTFYSLPIDRHLYILFKNIYYRLLEGRG